MDFRHIFAEPTHESNINILNFESLLTVSRNLVIIPTYNEKENIVKIIDAVFSLDMPFHILVVDDGSPDGTALIVKDLQNEFSQLYILERTEKAGLGRAYIAGLFRGASDIDYSAVNNRLYVSNFDSFSLVVQATQPRLPFAIDVIEFGAQP